MDIPYLPVDSCIYSLDIPIYFPYISRGCILISDCYLRQGVHPAWQGAGGMKIARNGSRICFLSFSTQIHAEPFIISRKNSILDHLCFYITHCSQKSLFLTSRQRFMIKVSGRNTCENAYKINSKTKFSTPIVQFSSHLHPALSNSLSKARQYSDKCFFFSIVWSRPKFHIKMCC